jgi:hypothetical protein
LEEFRNEVLALEGSDTDYDTDDNIEFELLDDGTEAGSAFNDSIELEEGSEFDDNVELEESESVDAFALELNNNNSDAKVESDAYEIEETGSPVDEEPDSAEEVSVSDENEKEDTSSDYSPEEGEDSDSTIQDVPDEEQLKELRHEMRELARSAPHVPPKYMLVWSDEMDRKYERIAKMQAEVLQQMITLKLRLEKYFQDKNAE